MIKQSAIDGFLSRSLWDSKRIKRMDDSHLRGELRKREFPEESTERLRKHQRSSVLIGLKKTRFLFLLDPGLGKTLVALEIMRHKIKQGEAKQFMVLVPNSGLIQTWKDEIEKFMPELRVLTVYGKENDRLKALSMASEILLTTYPTFMLMCAHKVKKRKGKKLINVLQLDKKKVVQYVDKIDGFVFDEAIAFRKRGSLTFDLCKMLSWTGEFAYGLTGTPFGRNPEDLWAEFHVIDKGETLGTALNIFRESLCTNVESAFTPWGTWVLSKNKQPVLHRMCRNRSIRYRDKECLDLPPLVRQKRYAELRPEMIRHYDKMCDEMTAANGNRQLLKNVFMRMRQLASGFLVFKNAAGARIEIPLPKNAKLEVLMELVSEIPGTEQIIIATDFISSGALVSDTLTKAKISNIRYFGGTLGKDKPKVIKAFTSGQKRVLVISRAGAMGLNLQEQCRYILFYESPVDVLVREQMERRIYRMGQKRKCLIYDVLVRGSIEEKILEYHKEGRDLQAAIMDGKEQPKCLIGNRS